MPGFTSRDHIINSLTEGQTESLVFSKNAIATNPAVSPAVWQQTFGMFSSLWTLKGAYPAGVNSATTGTLTNYTSGSGMTVSSPGTGAVRHLISFSISSNFQSQATTAGSLLLCDRLQSIYVNLNQARTITGGGQSVPRYAGAFAVNNELWIEWVTAGTAATSTVTVTYLDSAGTSRTTPSLAITPTVTTVGAMLRVPLVSSNTPGRGISQIVSITGTNAAGGNVNFVILRPLAWVPITAPAITVASQSVSAETNYLDGVLSLPKIFDNANLTFMEISAGGTSLQFRLCGTLKTAYTLT